MSNFPAHKEGLMALADKVDLNPVERDGQVLVLEEDLGRALGYANPALSVQKLYRQYESELKHYSTKTESVFVNGKTYATRGYTLEGALMLSMFARTNSAKRVRAWLARVGQERMEHMRQAVQAAQAQALELTEGIRQEALAQGRQQAAQAVIGLSSGVREICPTWWHTAKRA